jgi:hypothetical protein
MKKLFLILAIILVLPGCVFVRDRQIPAVYPIIPKPVLGKIEIPEDTLPAEKRAETWEKNTHTLFEYVEQLDAAVDTYNREAKKRNEMTP